MSRMTALVLALATTVVAAPRAQGAFHAPLDKLLDSEVRDGHVYYHALKVDRAPLDRYVASLDVAPATLAGWPRAAQIAFWINAYNALVLRTVIDHYPIHGSSKDYPPNSIRQIPGAFDALTHRVAGQSLTLDAIEKHLLATYGDARIVFALGRGAMGSGRLRSEAYTAAKLDAQLDDAVQEFVTRPTCLNLDRDRNTVTASPLFSWRQDAIVAAFDAPGDARWRQRSPIERAIVEMAYPHLFRDEQAFLVKNTFQMGFGAFDWRLNDLAKGTTP